MSKTTIRRAAGMLAGIPKIVANARGVGAAAATLSTGARGLRGRLPDFVNIDYRRTPATGLTMDLNVPRLGRSTVALAFSNAFFEPL
jgi:hypothetical protein